MKNHVLLTCIFFLHSFIRMCLSYVKPFFAATKRKLQLKKLERIFWVVAVLGRMKHLPIIFETSTTVSKNISFDNNKIVSACYDFNKFATIKMELSCIYSFISIFKTYQKHIASVNIISRLLSDAPQSYIIFSHSVSHFINLTQFNSQSLFAVLYNVHCTCKFQFVVILEWFCKIL